MRKKLDTRFPATRIKKIMQADEEVGKIAMVVPLLVSKALELFLQDLCDRTYEITIERGVKTVNSLHLKQCVRSFNSFDFLKDTVSKVPDLGGSDCAAEDKSVTKKRKIFEDEHDDDESGTIRMHKAEHVSSNKRGRGRPRGRGRGRGSGTLERETNVERNKSEEAGYSSEQNEKLTARRKDEDKSGRNLDVNASEDSAAALASAPCDDMIPGWSIDPGNLTGGMDEEDEDYDEE